MLDKFRDKVKSLQPGMRSLLRIAYPILLYTLMHFVAVAAGQKEMRPLQLVFLLLWGAIEYLVFLTKD